MKWCRFTAGGSTAYGIIEGDTVTAVEGSPFDGYTKTSKTHQLGSVQLEVPVVPPTFYAAGINYPEHVTWAAHMRGQEPDLPKKADVGYRAVNALVPDGHDIIVPADATEQLQYEGELVAVIGKTCRNVSETEALDYVLGYTIGNDVSERTWQRDDPNNWRAKDSDTFHPMGPFIGTDLDPTNLEVKVRLNDDEKIRFNTGKMIWAVADYIQKITRYHTLQPGDVIWTGTEGATLNMRPGDVIEIEIEGIGTLSNPIVAEP
jgi:2-keto-4-pentenoate hydratase/2-oxohepta-3-ene-1,7-dioic acid hydratase in catechol pathway